MTRQLQSMLFLVAVALLGPSAHADDVPTKACTVETFRDLPYYDAQDADSIKHKLDLYLPKDKKDFPILFFVHGGAWAQGDKNYFGVYSALGKCFAQQGIGTVVTNYRLSPKVVHPEHAKDVARAFAWTQKNIAKYGGRADALFLCGHSAGGHLAALIASDESHLQAEGLGLRNIKGVIPISGLFRIPDETFAQAFGKDPAILKSASPLTHIRAGLPPFLVIYADGDFPMCHQSSVELCQTLKDKKCEVESLQIEKRNHYTIIISASSDRDPACQAILSFISKHQK